MDALYYNGFKLAYRRYGASDAPAVVLIMGLGMSSAAWPTSLIAHLVREGFQVIRIIPLMKHAAPVRSTAKLMMPIVVFQNFIMFRPTLF